MKKIENIRELEAEELQDINGGFFIIIGTILSVAYWAWDNHDEIYAGMQEGVK